MQRADPPELGESAGARSISIVIPVYNEVESLEELLASIKKTVRGIDLARLDVIFIDDGSDDGSWQLIRRLALDDSSVHGIRFRRNFGKAAALAAGFEHATGDVVFTMDADLQDDPAEIPRMLAKLDEGWDVISGWKRVRHDPWHKTVPSRIFNWMVGRLTGVQIHDHNCGFKVYRTEVVRDLRLYGEMHRFVPVLASAQGWRVSEVTVNHRPRKFGHSKYGVARLMKGFLDLATVYFLTGFGERPLHLLGGLGLASFFLGTTGLVVLSAIWFISRLSEGIPDVHLHQRASFYYSIVGLLLGVQLLAAGLIAEMLAAATSRDVTLYSIAERAGVASNKSEAAAKRPFTEHDRA